MTLFFIFILKTISLTRIPREIERDPFRVSLKTAELWNFLFETSTQQSGFFISDQNLQS